MMAKFLYWLTGYLPYKRISEGNRRYLERYFVAEISGWEILIHRFLDDDAGRGLHDHPSRYAWSFVLVGQYIELVDEWVGAQLIRWVNFIPGGKFHKVMLPADSGECWTVFIRSPRVKDWGFITERHLKTDRTLIYSKSSTRNDWYLEAPKGKDSDRLPLPE